MTDCGNSFFTAVGWRPGEVQPQSSGSSSAGRWRRSGFAPAGSQLAEGCGGGRQSRLGRSFAKVQAHLRRRDDSARSAAPGAADRRLGAVVWRPSAMRSASARRRLPVLRFRSIPASPSSSCPSASVSYAPGLTGLSSVAGCGLPCTKKLAAALSTARSATGGQASGGRWAEPRDTRSSP